MEWHLDSDLSLRMLKHEDAVNLYEVVDQNRTHLRKWLPWLDANTGVEHSQAFIAASTSRHAVGAGFACGIFHHGGLVGVCGYQQMDASAKSVVIGYWLAEHAQGYGLMTRSVRHLIDYAFKELKLKQVRIPVAQGNQPSRAVCERLGLRSLGILTEAENLYGTLVDHLNYAVTCQEWSARACAPAAK